MKQELKRIEATLNQLQPSPPPTPSQPATPVSNPSPSFELPTPPSLNSAQPPSDLANRSALQLPAVNLSEIKSPSLPRVNAVNFTSHRNAANPALTMNLLKELEMGVMQWQTDLQTAVQQIQDLYLEGPIVDGWLESYTQAEAAEAMPSLRHADAQCLMDYVEKRWSAVAPAAPLVADGTSPRQDPNASGYRLCGLNEDGQFWFRHCPAEQVPAVSLAIARYQKLRQWLARKQEVESRLSQLAETLIGIHSQMHQ